LISEVSLCSGLKMEQNHSEQPLLESRRQMIYSTSTRFLIIAALTCSLAFARSTDDPPAPDRVEEDWELVIEQTDLPTVGPQMTTTMSPSGDNTGIFVALNLNYRENPFKAGGLEIQVWEGRYLIVKDSDKTAQCMTNGETITWTQRMNLVNGVVSYEIMNGHSTTWNDFGNANGLAVEWTADADVKDLTKYSPDVSIANSGVGWQSNNVRSMKLLRVRYYAADQLLRVDDMPREVSLTP
jgi:hypothetical protein